jgi:hypothetical protein
MLATSQAAAAALSAAAAQSNTSAQAGISADLVRRTEQGAESLLARQNLDPQSRYRGGIPDADGLYMHGTVGGIVEVLGTCFLYKGSKFFGNRQLLERIGLAVDFVMRGITPDGNIDLPITNFNSTPDTAFFVNPIATVAVLARRATATELSKLIEPLLVRVGKGLKQGGVHTPNHRWVVTSALAQLHELFGTQDDGYRKRANHWLSEGIDIDADGQFSERSTTVYNTVSDRGLTIAALKLNRPELLNPVRRNLESMLYLLHPGNEVVTEISKRQDKNVRAKPDRYWFPAKLLAVRDGNGSFESFAQAGALGQQLSLLLEYPELQQSVTPAPLPDQYVKVFPIVGIARIRRAKTSATVQFTGSDRVFCLRRGDAVMNGIRFASAFFGKGQFLPQHGGPAATGGGYEFAQDLSGPYYQPLADPSKEPAITLHEEWGASWKRRQQSEVCQLRQSVLVQEDKNGFRVRIRAEGTNDVPLAVEISFAPGGTLEAGAGSQKLKDDVYLLGPSPAVYRIGNDAIRVTGPATPPPHRYVNVRGALPKLDGISLYVTGLTPFDQTIRFDWPE